MYSVTEEGNILSKEKVLEHLNRSAMNSEEWYTLFKQIKLDPKHTLRQQTGFFKALGYVSSRAADDSYTGSYSNFCEYILERLQQKDPRRQEIIAEQEKCSFEAKALNLVGSESPINLSLQTLKKADLKNNNVLIDILNKMTGHEWKITSEGTYLYAEYNKKPFDNFLDSINEQTGIKLDNQNDKISDYIIFGESLIPKGTRTIGINLVNAVSSINEYIKAVEKFMEENDPVTRNTPKRKVKIIRDESTQSYVILKNKQEVDSSLDTYNSLRRQISECKSSQEVYELYLKIYNQKDSAKIELLNAPSEFPGSSYNQLLLQRMIIECTGSLADQNPNESLDHVDKIQKTLNQFSENKNSVKTNDNGFSTYQSSPTT